MKMNNIDVEDAAHAIFFYPEYENAILEDLRENSFVYDLTVDKIQEYSLKILGSEEKEERKNLEKSIYLLFNLKRVLSK